MTKALDFRPSDNNYWLVVGSHNGGDRAAMLPDAWLKSHPEHRWRIKDFRELEQRRSTRQKIANSKGKKS